MLPGHEGCLGDTAGGRINSFYTPPNPDVEMQMVNVMELGGGAFER